MAAMVVVTQSPVRRRGDAALNRPRRNLSQHLTAVPHKDPKGVTGWRFLREISNGQWAASQPVQTCPTMLLNISHGLDGAGSGPERLL